MDTDAAIYQEILTGQGPYLSQAARLLPPCREGRPTHPSTLYRWATRGVKLPSGDVLRLETVTLVGKLLTTNGALKRFLAAQATGEPPAGPSIRAPAKRAKAHQAAAEQLAAKYGI